MKPVSVLPWFLFLAALVAFVWQAVELHTTAREIVKPDTVYVPKFEPVPKLDTVPPAKVVIVRQAQPDLRKEIEGKSIIAGIDLVPLESITVSVIDTAGRITQQVYALNDLDRLTVQPNGQVSAKRRKWLGRTWANLRRQWKPVAAGLAAGVVAATVARK